MTFAGQPSALVWSVRLRWAMWCVAALLALTWAYGRFIAAPILAQRGESLSRLAALAALTESESHTRQSCEPIRAEAKRLEELHAAICRRIPQRSDESEFLQWISGQAAECGIAIHDFRPVSRQAQAPFEIQTVRIAGNGSYEAVSQLLDRLRECPRLNRVVQWEVNSAESNRSVLSLTLQIQLFSAPDLALEAVPSKGV